jgi:hypothetical protein
LPKKELWGSFNLAKILVLIELVKMKWKKRLGKELKEIAPFFLPLM